ncbi:hypothetical protein SEUCBS139899_002839 [Sporothrix eucalyptigena]
MLLPFIAPVPSWHDEIPLQSTGTSIYSFKNIPYAETPHIRTTVNRTVNDGFNPREVSATGIGGNPVATIGNLTNQSEDCMLVDVSVPKTVFDGKATGKLAPILVWIHGGG